MSEPSKPYTPKTFCLGQFAVAAHWACPRNRQRAAREGRADQSAVETNIALRVIANCHDRHDNRAILSEVCNMAHRCAPALVWLVAVAMSGCSSPTSPSLPPSNGLTPPATDSQVSVRVKSFEVIEFQYANGQWAYAPQVQVTETSGRTGVTVTSMQFSFPGLGQGPACIATKRVEAGETHDLLGVDDYGNYEIAYDQEGVRATARDAAVILAVVDDAGRAGTLTAAGPITAGQLPPVGGQRTIVNACRAR
jgi:hypothetical protein